MGQTGWYARPVLFVADVNRAIRFYVDMLGFWKKWHEGDGTGTVCQAGLVSARGVLTEDDLAVSAIDLFVELNVDELAEFRCDLVERSVPSRETWWGYDSIRIDDPDGNELLFPTESNSGAAIASTNTTDESLTSSQGPPRARRSSAGRCRLAAGAKIMTTEPASDTAKLTGTAPQFLVDDLDAAIAYYRGRLGFELDFRYESFYASVSRDGFAVHLKCAPKMFADRAHRKRHEHLDVYIGVIGATSLHDELRSRGALITKPLEERPWSCRDFYVEDLDGYILCFSEPTA